MNDITIMTRTVVNLEIVTFQKFLKATFKFLQSFHFIHGSSHLNFGDHRIKDVYKWFSEIIALFTYGEKSIFKTITLEINKSLQQYEITNPNAYPKNFIKNMKVHLKTMEEKIFNLNAPSVENNDDNIYSSLEKDFNTNLDYIESIVRKTCGQLDSETICQICLEAIEVYIAFSVQQQFLRLQLWNALFNQDSSLSEYQRELYGKDIKYMEKRFQAFYAFDIEEEQKKIKKTCISEFYGKPSRYLFLEEYLRYVSEKELYYTDNTQYKTAFNKTLMYCSKDQLNGNCQTILLEKQNVLKVNDIVSLFVPTKIKVTPFKETLFRDTVGKKNENDDETYTMNLAGPVIRENICFGDERFVRNITFKNGNQRLLVKVCEKPFFKGMCDYIDDNVKEIELGKDKEKTYEVKNIHNCTWSNGFSSFLVPHGFQVKTTQFSLGNSTEITRSFTGLQYVFETDTDRSSVLWKTLQPVRQIKIKSNT
ncbi:uncharacterized protein LOC136075301 [Hydra vulgaris]|uniref:Uncharacterized protein LOC136075301 n=1 Tax=Hydra vulgaris TaxID=6087 RepID=A0ABM4B5C7_HYDVU